MVIEPLPPRCVFVLDGDFVGELPSLRGSLAISLTMRLHEIRSVAASPTTLHGHLEILLHAKVVMRVLYQVLHQADLAKPWPGLLTRMLTTPLDEDG